MSKVSGPHNPDDVLIGFIDSPEVKALTALVAEAEGENVSDLFRKFVFSRAEAHGMMRGGKVVDEWRERVRESAAIIRNHVEYGVQLARKYNLKTPLRRAIESHHGDDFISFFYEKEKERTGTLPPEEPFRYPGPKPEELEVVILMLADCCEAAVCSMDDPTEEKVRAKVEEIFNAKLRRGQLDAATVTMAQLAKIREAFLKTFKSMNHTRISYARHQEEDK